MLACLTIDYAPVSSTNQLRVSILGEFFKPLFCDCISWRGKHVIKMYKRILSTIFCLRRQAYNEIYWWVKGFSWALCEIKKCILKQNYCPKSNITTVALATFSYQLNGLHSLWFTLAMVFWWEGWLKEVFFLKDYYFKSALFTHYIWRKMQGCMSFKVFYQYF